MITESANAVAVTDRLRDGNVPLHYLECDLRSTEADEMAAAMMESGRGFYLYGPNGVGKTHLAAGILASVVERTGVEVMFVTAMELMQRFRLNSHADNFSKDDQGRSERLANAHEIERIKCAAVLVLDDLDKASLTSDYMHEQLFELVNARYNNEAPTVVTANCDYPELSAKFRDSGFARSTLSRFKEMMRQHKMDGKDRRLVSDGAATSDEVPQRWYIPEYIGCSFECEEARRDQAKRRRDGSVGFQYRCPNLCTDVDGEPSTLVPLSSEHSTETVFCCSICHEVMTKDEAHEAHLHESETAEV